METNLSGFRRQPHTRAQGRVGEEEAVRWLRSQGYRIVERNARTKGGEIDVIAWDGDNLCFIEVKARATGDYGPSIAAITPRKRRRLVRATKHYIVERGIEDTQLRFDVLGLDAGEEGWRYTLIKNAFEA